MEKTDMPPQKPANKSRIKFILFSLIGVFLFLIPIPTAPDEDGYRAFNISLGFAINWLEDQMSRVSVGEYGPEDDRSELGIHYVLMLVFITVSFLGAIYTKIAKPKFVMDTPMLKSAFLCSPVYFVSRGIGFALVWMMFLGLGPDIIIADYTGDVMLGLTASLVVLFILLGPTLPILTDFGLMEFVGVGMKKIVRPLFTVPGRAAIDLIASWFGSSNASILITREQLEKGQYTVREAAAITTNFSFVSLPFTFVVASFVGLQAQFLWFYLVMSITVFILALITPRIWPLSRIPDEYLADVGKKINEEVPEGVSGFQFALDSASERANASTAKDFAKSGADAYLGIFMDLIPVILAWGTIALVVAEETLLFTWISYPFGFVLELFRIEGAFDYAPAVLVGFVDMFIPAVMLESAPPSTAFILGVLSIVQLIYLSETGVMIMKSRMQLNIVKLFVIFLIRTIIALPIIVGLFWLLPINL